MNAGTSTVRRRSKLRLVLWLMAALVVIGVAIVILTSPRKSYLARQSLPDGSPITLIDLTVGHRHLSPLAPFVDRLGARLPPAWRSRLKFQSPPSTSAEVSSNYLTVWITTPGRSDGTAPRWQLLVGDDRDNFSAVNTSYSRPVAVPMASNMWLQGLPLLSWPRRADTLRIQFYDDSSHPPKKLADFRVENPARDRKTRPWSAAPWPVTVKDGDLDFTLTSLWLGLAWPGDDWKLRPERDPLQRRTRATFRVTKDGQVQTNWNAYHVREIYDATGNWSHGNSFQSTIRNGETMNQFGQLPLPVDEPWRITVQFSRLSGFTPAELHTVKALSMPKEGKYGSGITNTFGQQKLIVYWEQPWLDKSPYQIGARVEPQPRGYGLALIRTNYVYRLTLVRATDDRGRDVTLKSHGHGPGSTHDILKLEPDATSVDLLLAYHPSRLVTFQAQPQFYSADKRAK